MHTQLSPWLVPALEPTRTGRTASTSASSRTIAADLPPSSSTHGLISAPHALPICLPTSTEPVKLTMSTSGCVTSRSEASRFAATMLITPGGKPASVTRSAIANSDSGSGSGALTTTVQPATSAGAVFCAMPGSGKLNAVIAATTPTGSRTSRLLLSYFMISPPAFPASGDRSASRTSANVCSRPFWA
jgi:hypothetical protein